jgi:hypothetical protein
MRTRFLLAPLAGALLLAGATPAPGDAVAIPTIPERVARASAVVVGKVVRLEDKTVSVPSRPGLRKEEYQVAVVRITEGLYGVKGLTHVRIGLVPRPRSGGRLTATDLRPGQEGCFFLSEHPVAPFYILPTPFDVIARESNAGFDPEVREARRAARLLADPLKYLRGKDARDRYLTAALLVVRYRTAPPVPFERRGTEPIGARESGLILKALAEPQWKGGWKPPGLGAHDQLSPQSVFLRLGVAEKDGFVRPRNLRDFPDAARKWLRDHAGSYRIRRFVVKKDKKDG